MKYTGIQYTTEWTFTRATGGVADIERCRLVKQLNGNMTVFYTNEEVANMDTDQYQTAFINTLTYMASRGWNVFPTFEDSCKTNIKDCPIIPPSKYAVLPIAFVCQDSGLAIMPPMRTGIKMASTFQYLINGTASGNLRLVKTFNGSTATYFTDTEISMLGDGGLIHPVKYSDALNKTMQYMAYLGWLATPDINACMLTDITACPMKKVTNRIDVVNLDVSIHPYAFTSDAPVMVTAEINGNSGQTQVAQENNTGMVVLTNVDLKLENNEIEFTFNPGIYVLNDLNMNIEYGEIEQEWDEDVLTVKIPVLASDISRMIITNNGVRTLNLEIEFQAIM
jgi:hypothetical protein